MGYSEHYGIIRRKVTPNSWTLGRNKFKKLNKK